MWAPFLSTVSQRAGACLTPRTSSSISQSDSRLLLGEGDFALPVPSSLVRVRRQITYRVLLASGTRRIRGVLVVRADSPVRQLADLREVVLAVPSADAYLTSLLIQQRLRRAGVRCRLVESGTPSNVLRAVANGRADAGGSIDRILDGYQPEVRDRLRVLFATPAFMPPPLVAHPRVPGPVREAVALAIVGMQYDDLGRGLLHRVYLDDPVRIDFAHYAAELAGVATAQPGCAPG